MVVETTHPTPHASPISRRSLLLGVAAFAVLPVVGGVAFTDPAYAGTGNHGNTGGNGGTGGNPGNNGNTLTVSAGETVTIETTTTLNELTIAEGGAIIGPDGTSLSVTVNGVETGSKLPSLYDDNGIVTYIAAGTYRGQVVIDVAEANIISYGDLEWPIRQALYVDADGIDQEKSVSSAISGGNVDANAARNVTIRSTGEAFNGIWVDGGATYSIQAPRIELQGNGRNDFIGYGAAITGTGASYLTVDAATVENRGVVRTAVIADGGSTVVVKNSVLTVHDGTPPAEYENTGDTNFMMTCPWLLGMYGTVRATNLLGTGTKAAYVNSQVTTETWGALSVDGGSDCTLVALNTTATNTGDDGYGTYGIGNVTEHLLGVTFDVATYATILWAPNSVHYGDSARDAVAALNDSLGLGLSGNELQALTPRSSVITSRKFGFMWQSTGELLLDGGTQVTTALSTFVSKASASTVVVNGRNVSLKPGNGIVYQLMDNDNPGGVDAVDKPWSREYTASYVEPTDSITKSTSFDPTTASSADATGTFTGATLNGNFYNGVRGGGYKDLQGQNLVLSFTDTTVTGVLSATTTTHRESPINFDNYRQLGVIDNTVSPVVNNGVIVTLDGRSQWRVTGTSYLSKLVVGADARVVGARRVTVDGTDTTITPGSTYTGAITITV
ncbi:MAG: hypothetical protein QM626_00470 [Microbacterium sp.]|uniref:hypothetical protein n=1 Tax=Microbacterium sp. TaxID=51671 RepID=UPI0039E2B873